MSNIKIIADSSGDIPRSIAEDLDITIAPLTVYFGDEEYLDYYDLDSEAFFDKLTNTNVMPRTAQVSIERFYNDFEAAVNEGKRVICLTISSSGSGTYQAACLAREQLLEKQECEIDIIDTRNYSIVFGVMAIEAAIMAKNGEAKEDILNKIQYYIESYEIVFVVDTLKYLKMGGRINAAQAMIGGVLDIKPVLSVVKGLVETVGKVRGRKKVMQYIVDYLKERGLKEGMKAYIMYSGDITPPKELEAELFAQCGNTVSLMCPVGATIGVHTGPGVLGAIFFKE